jgi:UDP-N-acetylmuramoylalanine--D-glutamate ligase
MDLAGKRVVVMGLGRFGGGAGVARFLVSRRARVLVTDLEPRESLTKGLALIAGLPVELRLGEHRVEDFTAADLIVVNPAVDPRQNKFLQAARAAGVATTSEIRLLIAHLPQPRRTIGVTGSAGKSTTTAMIGHILRRALGADRVFVGGNIGGSLLDRLDQIGPEAWVVLELSSFMLEDAAVGGERWSPHIAVLTNLAPNHLDRHGTLAAYAQAKQEIFAHQGPGDHALIGPVPPGLVHPRTTRLVYLDGLDTYTPQPKLELLIPGAHNLQNARMALEVAVRAGVDRAMGSAALRDFPGLPHRLQFVPGPPGVRCYDDSKATTPEAAMLALQSFPPHVVHVILGGYDKGSDLVPLAQFAARHCRAVYTIGKTGPVIADACAAARPPGPLPTGGTGGAGGAEVVRCATLDQAVAAARPRLRPGDVLLLSPACASWDQFENYEQRGDAFAQAASGLTL